MAKAAKHGNKWRARVYVGRSPDGKPLYETVTADSEALANLAAEEVKEKYRNLTYTPTNLTLEEAMVEYIESKSNILSPSTLRGYDSYSRTYFLDIQGVKLGRLNNNMIQISLDRCAEKHSPKSVQNAYGFLSAVIKKYNPRFELDVSIPSKELDVPFEAQYLTEDEIVRLLQAIRGTNVEIPVLLAAWLGLRRSEILGLRWDRIDFENRTISIIEARVLGRDHKMISKGTKTKKSKRTLRIPQYIYDRLLTHERRGEYVVDVGGGALLRRFHKICEANNIPCVRFHDLRHTMASVGALLNISDKYMMERGGWSSIQTMKNIYQHAMRDKVNAADRSIDEYFMGLVEKGTEVKDEIVCEEEISAISEDESLQMIKTWGEFLDIDSAAKMSGFTASEITALISEKKIRITPTNRVVTRSIIDYINGAGSI